MRGMTLIEILVMVTILALVAAIAVPAAAPDYEYRLDRVQVQVEDAVAWAQALAVATGRTHGVVFDLVGERLAVVDCTGTPVTDPLTKGAYVISFRRPDQPQGIDFQLALFGATDTSVIFDGKGVPLYGGLITLACHDASRSLAVDAVTGRVTIR